MSRRLVFGLLILLFALFGTIWGLTLNRDPLPGSDSPTAQRPAAPDAQADPPASETRSAAATITAKGTPNGQAETTPETPAAAAAPAQASPPDPTPQPAAAAPVVAAPAPQPTTPPVPEAPAVAAVAIPVPAPPPAATPPVEAPAATVPPVALAPVAVPPVAVPPIAVPPVAVPPVAVPPVAAPPAALPPAFATVIAPPRSDDSGEDSQVAVVHVVPPVAVALPARDVPSVASTVAPPSVPPTAPVVAPPPAQPVQVVPPAPVAPPQVVAVVPPPPPAPRRIVPSFDIVRVSPDGMAVIAGRGEPGAAISVTDGGREIGRATADARGEWVVILAGALAAGTRELALVSRGPGDMPELRSDRVVVLAVPERAAQQSAGGTLAVSMPRDPTASEASRALQVPNVKPAAGGMALALESVDYDAQGNLVLGGRAPSGTSLQVYVDAKSIGRVITDPDGRWQLTPEAQIAPGVYTLRVDQLAADGRVAQRIELPFSRAEPSQDLIGDADKIVVQPGNSLWRIARRIYGEGTRYTVIYQANRVMIRDPDMIYPGQVFAVPPRN